MSNVAAPNDVQFHVYSDYEWDDIIREDFIESIKFPRPKHDVWKCPKCSRVYVFDDTGKVIAKYILELD